jgi:hypothetical protein
MVRQRCDCTIGSARPIRPVSLFLSGLACALLLAGCATNENEPIRPLRPLELALSAYDGNISERLTGSLAYEDSCLMFRNDEAGPMLTPIWPKGTTFDGTALIYHEPGRADQSLLVTQQFRMGGRRVAWQQLSAQVYQPFQSQCRGEPFLVSEVRPAD